MPIPFPATKLLVGLNRAIGLWLLELLTELCSSTFKLRLSQRARLHEERADDSQEDDDCSHVVWRL